MSASDEVFAIIEAHDFGCASLLRDKVGPGGIPDALARAYLSRASDDPLFIIENLDTYAGGDAEEREVMLAFIEDEGLEKVLRAIDGTPTPSDLSAQFRGGK